MRPDRMMGENNKITNNPYANWTFHRHQLIRPYPDLI